MSGAWTIARRELGAFFRLPLGWVAIALYLFLGGIVFGLGVLVPGQAASLRSFFATSAWLLLPVAPALTMRLMSEELRTGTIEPLLTSPVSDGAIIGGKFAGAVLFLALMVAPTGLYALVLTLAAAQPLDWGPVVAGYLALLLLGMFYLSVGLLVSTLTSNQTLAFLGTLFALVGLLMATGPGAEAAPGWLKPALLAVAPQARLADFARGVIDTANVVYFVSGAAWMLVLATVLLQSRRWR